MAEAPLLNPGTDRETIRLFWRESLHEKKLLYATVLYPISTVLLSTIVPLCIGKAIASLSYGNSNPMDYLWYFVAAAAIGVLFNRIGFRLFIVYQAQTMYRLQAKALHALLRRSTGFHNNNIGGKLVSDTADFPNGFGTLANTTYAQLMPFVVTLVSGTIVIFLESWLLGVVMLVMILFAVGTGISESRRRSGLRSKRLVASKKVIAHLADTILNVQTVKTFAQEVQEISTHNRLGKNLERMRVRDWSTSVTRGSDRIAVLMVMQVIFVFVTIWLVRNDPALLGVGIFAFAFTITLSNRLFDINNMIRSVEDGLLLASPMTEILMQEPEIVDSADAKPLKLKKGQLAFQDVHFRYADSTVTKDVFQSLNLTIKPGEKIGLVGPSGGGKSTLTRLLLRFEDIDSGTIAIDGQDITSVTQASLREAISYVPQEPLLFHRTVGENIAYGQTEPNQKAVKKAAKAAEADDFIQNLPDGYDTVVGERGVKLSGGQRQRIAIARAILKNAPILVLDEATSALDSESEVLIQRALWELMKDRTAIVIAHRLSTIQKMDRIIVLNEGTIVEEGTHKELLAKKGLYARLWSHQSGGFIEE